MYAVSEMVNIHFIVTCRVYCLIIVFLYIISLTWNDLYLVYIFKSYFSIFYLGFFPNLIYFLHFEPLIESQKSDASSMQLGEVRTSNNLDTGPALKTRYVRLCRRCSKGSKKYVISPCFDTYIMLTMTNTEPEHKTYLCLFY